MSWRTQIQRVISAMAAKNDDTGYDQMSWFSNRPILVGEMSEDDKLSRKALDKVGHKSTKMVGAYCAECEREDGDHDTSCGNLN